ncbi:MAG: T9SS type A sorting domain-containing protein [Bacteroidia bacterium]|nr:T9SS type A sorting domain-containing protein [Bacteroidia bacterium]
MKYDNIFKTRILPLIFLVFHCCIVYPQNEDKIWYFGDHAGLDFNDGYSIALTNSAMETHEGCASISDRNGNLLFYTNGVNVWNRLHTTMPNGNGLTGDNSSTQSAIIVPKPLTEYFYYIFTTGAQLLYSSGFRYSEVNMTLANGYGDINNNKNILLLDSVCEKITAVKHSNNTDIWVITHKWNSNAYYTYLVTDLGINPEPVISNTGTIVAGDNIFTIGYLKASQDGSRIAAAHYGMDIVDICNFDNCTGKISNCISLNGFHNYPYGVEFSPNGNFIYISEDTDTISYLYQFNLNACDYSDILNSRVLIGADILLFGALQVGPDNKIYITKLYSGYLGTITYPDSTNIECNFINDGISLNGKISRGGLPPSRSPYLYKDRFSVTGTCYGIITHFTLYIPGYDSLTWNFGDTASLNQNISHFLNPWHLFTHSGNFLVSVIVYAAGTTDTIIHNIHILDYPDINFGSDTVLCEEEYLVLNAYYPYTTFLWSDGSTSSDLTISTSETYWVNVTNICGSDFDQITVSYNNINLELGDNIHICRGDSVALNVEIPDATYLWQDGYTGAVYTADTAGTYWVETTVGYCTKSDTVRIFLDDSINDILKAFDDYCTGDSLFLDAGNTGAEFHWSTGDTSRSLFIHQPGIYYLTVTNACSTVTDTIAIFENELPDINLGNDTMIPTIDTIILNAGSGFLTYLWNNESTDQTIVIYGDSEAPGNYMYEVTVQDNNHCYNSDTIYLTIISSIHFKEKDKSIIVFPNPNKGKFIVKSEEFNRKGAFIKVYNCKGQCIISGEFTTLEKYIDLTGRSKGIYYLIHYNEHVFRTIKIIIL